MRISPRTDENLKQKCLLAPFTTIPAAYSHRIWFEERGEDGLTLEFVEVLADGQEAEIAEVCFPGSGGPEEFEVKTEVDANKLIVVTVHDLRRRIAHPFQLTNHNAKAFIPEREGFATRPLRHLCVTNQSH